MIAVIGNGYIGSAFLKELEIRKGPFCHIPHGMVDGFWKAHELFKKVSTSVVINCAAFIPKESVSLCDQHPEETITGNVVLPSVLSAACEDRGTTFCQISTGCLWDDGKMHSELDAPQRAFTGHCGFYIGTKVLAEQEVSKSEKHYIFRVRLPFDEKDNERNYLSKISKFKQVRNHTNSISHRADFARACLDLIERGAVFGTYNITNEGSISASVLVELLRDKGIIKHTPEIIEKKGGDCQTDISKLLNWGVKMRTAQQAVEESLTNWTK